MSADLHNVRMITYPRCDGSIDDIVVYALGIAVVFKLGFRWENCFEEPIEEFFVTATEDTLARVRRKECADDTHMPRLGNWHACWMLNAQYSVRVAREDDVRRGYRSSPA